MHDANEAIQDALQQNEISGMLFCKDIFVTFNDCAGVKKYTG
jgi:hypothetical protein